MKSKRTSTGLNLVTMILLLSLSGCATGTVAYRPTIPTLTAPPQVNDCQVQAGQDGEPQATKCVTMLLEDLTKLVRELEAACIGSGHELEECFAKP